MGEEILRRAPTAAAAESGGSIPMDGDFVDFRRDPGISPMRSENRDDGGYVGMTVGLWSFAKRKVLLLIAILSAPLKPGGPVFTTALYLIRAWLSFPTGVRR